MIDPSHKLFTLERLASVRESLRVAGETVVLTNGCFDILHVGHVRYLRQARALGGFLIVGLNSDDSVRALKGPSRPLIAQEERAEVLAALECVDAVVVFTEPTAERLAQVLQPDIYVKGGDYRVDGGSGKDLPEARIVTAYGGRVQIVPLVPGYSTTDIVKSIVEKHNLEKHDLNDQH